MKHVELRMWQDKIKQKTNRVPQTAKSDSFLNVQLKPVAKDAQTPEQGQLEDVNLKVYMRKTVDLSGSLLDVYLLSNSSLNLNYFYSYVLWSVRLYLYHSILSSISSSSKL